MIYIYTRKYFNTSTKVQLLITVITKHFLLVSMLDSRESSVLFFHHQIKAGLKEQYTYIRYIYSKVISDTTKWQPEKHITL